MRIFISSPYRPTNGLTVEGNKSRAEKYAHSVFLLGHEPFIPHTQYEWTLHYYDVHAANDLAIQLCMQEIERCDEVWQFLEQGCKETSGMRQERIYAQGLEILVRDGLGKLREGGIAW